MWDYLARPTMLACAQVQPRNELRSSWTGSDQDDHINELVTCVTHLSTTRVTMSTQSAELAHWPASLPRRSGKLIASHCGALMLMSRKLRIAFKSPLSYWTVKFGPVLDALFANCSSHKLRRITSARPMLDQILASLCRMLSVYATALWMADRGVADLPSHDRVAATSTQ